MNRTLRLTVALCALPFMTLSAFAQDEEVGDDTSREVKYKERTEIDFEGVDVNGELVKPQGQLLLDRRKADFNPLIKLRDSFDTEMKQSVDEVK